MMGTAQMAARKSLKTGSPGTITLSKRAMDNLIAHCEAAPKANNALLSFVGSEAKAARDEPLKR